MAKENAAGHPDPMIQPPHPMFGEITAELRHCTHILLFLVLIHGYCLELTWLQPLKDKKLFEEDCTVISNAHLRNHLF